MICEGCGNDVRPIVSMGAQGIEKVCPSPGCNRVFERAAPLVQQAATPAPVARRAAPKQESFDVVKAAKKRLRHVKSEVKRLRKELTSAEKEEGQLSRLLDAAEPKATVRKLRAAGS